MCVCMIVSVFIRKRLSMAGGTDLKEHFWKRTKDS